MNINRRGDVYTASSLFCALTRSAAERVGVPVGGGRRKDG